MNKTVEQFVRFSLIGLLNTLLDFSLYFSLSRWLGVNYLLANAIGFLCSVTMSYLLNKKITFDSKNKNIFLEYILYFSFSLITLFIVEMVMYTGVTLLNFNDLLIKLLATAVSVVFNFVFSKFIIFKKTS